MLGQKLKHLREKCNLTQNELARLLNVGRTTITMWETGANTPPTKYLIPLANALCCHIEELLREDDDSEH